MSQTVIITDDKREIEEIKDVKKIIVDEHKNLLVLMFMNKTINYNIDKIFCFTVVDDPVVNQSYTG